MIDSFTKTHHCYCDNKCFPAILPITRHWCNRINPNSRLHVVDPESTRDVKNLLNLSTELV
jgi:hypothetical protein